MNETLEYQDLELRPGNHGDDCPGNGEHPGIECCCDECDFALACFPEYDKGGKVIYMEYKTTMVWSKQNPVDHCFIVEVGRCSFTVLYGQYINGGWCAIPNWNISCNMGEPEDIDYNADKLFAAFAKQKEGTVKEEVCVAIANALADVYS